MSKPIFWKKEKEEKYSQYVICLFSLEGVKNFSIKIFVVATHQMCLGQALIMSTQNMLFFFFVLFFLWRKHYPQIITTCKYIDLFNKSYGYITEKSWVKFKVDRVAFRDGQWLFISWEIYKSELYKYIIAWYCLKGHKGPYCVLLNKGPKNVKGPKNLKHILITTNFKLLYSTWLPHIPYKCSQAIQITA